MDEWWRHPHEDGRSYSTLTEFLNEFLEENYERILSRRHDLLKEDREEIIQDALASAIKEIGKKKYTHQNTIGLLVWLRGIAIHKLRSAQRHHYVVQKYETDMEHQGIEDFQDLDQAPDEKPQKKELRRDLGQCLRKLPDNRRHVVVQYYIRHRSYDDIAAEMNTTKENVRKLASRGISDLKRHLQAVGW